MAKGIIYLMFFKVWKKNLKKAKMLSPKRVLVLLQVGVTFAERKA